MALETAESLGTGTGVVRTGGALLKLLHMRFGSLLLFGVIFLAASLALRTALLVSSFGEMGEVGAVGLLKVYGMGLVFDLGTYFCCMLPTAVYLLLVPDRIFRWKPTRYLGLVLYFAGVFLVLFDVAAEWLFWQEFGTRFNFIAIDYLVYTEELIGNAAESYPVKTILGVLLVCATALVLLTRRPFLRSYESSSTLRQRLAAGLVYALLACATLLVVRPGWAKVTENHYANELARNGLYSLVSAVWENSIDYPGLYRTEDRTRVFGHLRQLLAGPNSRFVSEDPFDITRHVEYPGPEKRHNVVIVTVESLDAVFLGAFGSNRRLTPNLDELAGQGLLFRRLYATGNRTVRGLEAIAASLPPTPGTSVIKRPNCGGLFTAGQLFRGKGYDAKFLYGGNGYFDNMNAFFGGNGFEVVDWSTLTPAEITFRNVWGVCDGDLFSRVLVECDKSFAAGRPFFSMVMTTSNHQPYTYPQKVDTLSGSNRKGAVKYTDYAIGEFIRQAKDKPWFADTLFVVIADHCANSAGKVDVPVAKYHIPLIIYGPGIVAAGQCDTLCSQMDLVPTLLGLLNMSYTSKFFGRDVLHDPPGRALLGTYQLLGLVEEDSLTLLGPNREAAAWQVNGLAAQTPGALSADRLFDTITYYQAASDLLEHGLYSAP